MQKKDLAVLGALLFLPALSRTSVVLKKDLTPPSTFPFSTRYSKERYNQIVNMIYRLSAKSLKAHEVNLVIDRLVRIYRGGEPINRYEPEITNLLGRSGWAIPELIGLIK